MLILPYKGKSPIFGQGVYIAPNATIIGDVEVGKGSSIWFGTVVRGDVHHIRIGEETNIQDNCCVHVTNGKWPCEIGHRVSVGHGAIVHGCVVADGCLIGMGALILDGAEVGEESLVAAGAVVTEGMKIPPRSLVAGVPARIKRELTADELERVRKNSAYYVEYCKEYLGENR